MNTKCFSVRRDEIDSIDANLRASTVAVLLRENLSEDAMRGLAKTLLRRPRRLIAIFGSTAERFHDRVDEIARGLPWDEPTTTWESEGALQNFLWDVFFSFRGLDADVDTEGVCIIDVSTLVSSCADIASMLAEWKIDCDVC